MRKTKKILSVALASTMVLSLAACGGKSTTETTQAAAETTAAAESSAAETTAEADGFNLAVCLASEPQTMDPALNSTVDGAIMTQHMFEGLAKYVNDGNGNAQIVAGQAESWEKVVNDDGTVTYTFKMRPDAKWSDGQKVTAGDFEYSWKRLANPQTAADYTYMIDMVKGYQEIQDGADPDTLAVKAIDDDTLEITLSYDCPYFEDVLAFPATLPVRQDVVEGNEEWTYDPSTYITNGAYKLVEWSHNAYILTEKNPEYYDYANLGPDTIKYTLLDDANAMLAAYKSGELQFIEQVPTDEIPNYLASGELQISDYIEQSVCLCGIQRRCRLVHDDQSGITGYCFDDLNHLYLCQCQFFHFSSSRIRNIELIQNLLTPFVLCLLIQKNSFCIFTFQENTFCYRQMRLRIQLLMDHGNTTVQSIYRTFCLIRFSFKLHRSCILFDESDHTFHQCGFTCTVFSQQCMYFTRFHM